MAISGTGATLPPKSLPFVDIQKAGNLTVRILSVENQDGMDMAKVEYPDGFVRTHQAISVSDLLGKIQNQIKGRYGVNTFEIASIPADLQPNQKFEFTGVTYDA